VASASKISFLPTRISIPDLTIDLPVIPARIKDGHWPTTPVGVSYLTTSARPGEPGNSIFYGHNWPRLLGRLKKVQPGQIILLSTSSNSAALKFQVDRVQTVSPSDISVLASTSYPQLTLYTCTGFSDSQRLVVIAYPRK
jgi:LPXTG-site transpeptidase (sortase) family protein